MFLHIKKDMDQTCLHRHRDRQTDGQTEKVIPIYNPLPNFVCKAINMRETGSELKLSLSLS